MILTDVLSNLLKLGVSVSGQQYELLKWRTSDEAKKYYTKEENKEFYKNLKKGNLDVVDAIRKEKQMKIEQLKKSLLPLILFILFLFNGCISIPVSTERTWDVNSLKTEDHTFRIKEQTIKVDGEWSSIKFNEGWYIVSEDHIKTFNENQDTLIETLTLLQSERKQKMYIISGVGILSLLGLLWILAKLTIGRKP